MSIEHAKQILATYTLPMTKEQAERYKEALKIVAGYGLRAPS